MATQTQDEVLSASHIPSHVAIIMDGNGRWAKQRGLPRTEGHIRGQNALRTTLRAAARRGIKYLTVYTFSTENWSRPQEEVDALMSILVSAIHAETPQLIAEGVRMRAIGDLSRLPQQAQDSLAESIELTKDGAQITLILALSYSSRDEIRRASQRLAAEAAAGHLRPEEITEELIKKEGLKVNSGFYVADFAEISGALAAGIEKGDVIVAIEGHKISSFGQLQEQVSRFRPGDTIKVTVNRKGAEKTFAVKLRNKEGGASILKQNSSSVDARLGAKVRQLETAQLRNYGLSYGLVVESLSAGALKRAGVREGFVLLTANDSPLRSIADLNRAFGSSGQARRTRGVVLRGFYPESGDIVSYVVE